MRFACFLTLLYSSVLVGQTSIPDLSRSDGWRALLHYDDVSWDESRIDSKLFFLSRKGKTDPLAELMKTIKVLQDNKKKIGPEKLLPLCAFPARARFLRKHLKLDFPQVECSGIGRWKSEIAPKSVSIVFSAAYPGNPASMFGHTFLKFDSGKKGAHYLRDYGASYSAKTEDESAFLYFYKGMTGGYKGVFTLNPYYEKISEYARFENRDLWEYPLELSAEQQMFLLEHFWELYATANLDYYFLTENCALILLSVLDAVLPEKKLMDSWHFAVTPHETISRLVDRGVIKKKPRFRPSLQRTYSYLYEKASQADRDLSVKAAKKTIEPELISSKPALDLALAYLAYEKALKYENVPKDFKKYEKTLLKQRASLGKAKKKRRVPKAQSRPDKGLSPYYVYYRLDEDWMRLGARYGFHGLDESHVGYEPNLHIEYLRFNFTYSVKEEILKSDDFTLADVMSLNKCNALECEHSWRILFDRRSYAGDKYAPIKLLGHLGVTHVSDMFQVWFLTGGGLQALSLDKAIDFRFNINYGFQYALTESLNVFSDASSFVVAGKGVSGNEGRVSIGYQIFRNDRLHIGGSWQKEHDPLPYIEYRRYF